jgi:hypothetical protein
MCDSFPFADYLLIRGRNNRVAERPINIAIATHPITLVSGLLM